MKHFVALSILILSLLIIPSKCYNSDCDKVDLTWPSEVPGPGLDESDEDLSSLFNKYICSMKKKYENFGEKVKENAEKLKENVGEGVKKFAKRAKEVGSDFKIKFNDFKERLYKDSDETVGSDKKFFLENIEIINPDILKVDQECGHGHILDSLGNCRKLRK